jgi:hypothetical protein
MSFNDLYKEIISKSYTKLTDDKCVSFSGKGLTGKRYIDADDLRRIYFAYISNKIEHPINGECITDDNNTLQVMYAHNVLYLDIDFKFIPDLSDAEMKGICQKLTYDYLQFWISKLMKSLIEYFYISFIPQTYKGNKGGGHVMIFCETEIPKENRSLWYKDIKYLMIDKMLKEYFKYILAETNNPNEWLNMNYNKLFDSGPLLSSLTCLLPFAKKSKESRNYMLFSENFTAEYRITDTFIIPRFQSKDEKETIEWEQPDDISEDSDEINDEDNNDTIYSTEQELSFNNIINIVKSKEFGQCGDIIFKFVESLKYLSNKHEFWNAMDDFNRRFKEIIIPVISIMRFCMFITKRGLLGCDVDQKIIDRCFITLEPLRRKAYNLNRNQHNNPIEFHLTKLKEQIEAVVKHNEMEFCDVNERCWNLYCKLKKKQREALKTQKTLTISQGNNDNDDEELKLELFEIDKIKHIFNKWWKKFREFIWFIIKYITDEIEPFIEVDKEENPRTVNNIRLTFQDLKQRGGNIDDIFYNETIKLWITVFMFVQLQSTRNMNETLRSIVSAFTSQYICTLCGNGKTNDNTVLIYNIQQTESLRELPYNQWVMDSSKSRNLLSWFNHIYQNFIYPQLMTEELNENLRPMYLILKEAEIYEINNKEFDCYHNFKSNLKQLYDDITTSIDCDMYKRPRQIAVTAQNSNWFPMKNGLLEFNKFSGECIFHDDNHERYMLAYSHVLWDPNYQKHNEIANEVKKMWNTIYPDKSVREYTKMMFSSVLHGLTLKDQFLILHGSGGDGKTTICTAIKGMLGCGENYHVEYKDCFGVQHNDEIKNPSVMAGTIRSECILIGQKASHGEGGDIELYNRRFCDMQEPSTSISNGKINVPYVKDICGGGCINTRHIYAESKTFVPNCLLVLQTNSVLGYSETGDAAKRRISIIPHESKFYTSNKPIGNDVTNKFKANSELINNLQTNPMWQQAVFYSLLPYAKKLIQTLQSDSKLSLSNIPRPNKIIEATNQSFDNGNALNEWLKREYVPCEGYALKFTSVFKSLISNDNGSNRDQKILEGSNLGAKRKWLTEQLFEYYSGNVYALKDDFIHKNKRGKVKIDEPDFDADDFNSNNELIEKYFKPSAVRNYTLAGKYMNEDLYIVGYSDRYEED